MTREALHASWPDGFSLAASWGLPAADSGAWNWTFWVFTLWALALWGHLTLCVGVVNRLHGWGGPKRLIDVLTAATAVILPAFPLAHCVQAWQSDDTLTALTTLNSYAIACVLFAIVGMLLKWVWIEPRRYHRPTLASWRADASPVDGVDSASLCKGSLARALSYFPGNESCRLSTDHKVLRLPRLPRALDGFRIAHLSDLHMTGRIDRPFYDAMVARVVASQPDVICITGDIIENEACLAWLVHPLGELKAPFGVYYVLGNHDAYIDQEQTHRVLGEQGFVSVAGRWVQCRWRGVPIELGGTEAPWGKAPSLPDVEQTLRIVLSHSPDQFGWCRRARADLVLAGHTHGGQVQLPLWGPLASPSLYGTRYACGVFYRDGVVMHATRGIAGKTPLRWRCPPEIALLSLCGPERRPELNREALCEPGPSA